MKKITAFLMAILMTVALIGCNKTSPNQTQAENTKTEFEIAMDDFERYLNEYCTFIEEYSKADPTKQLSMLAKYDALVNDYMSAEEKVRAIDEEALNPDELAYYIEVMTRCGERMSEVQENMQSVG